MMKSLASPFFHFVGYDELKEGNREHIAIFEDTGRHFVENMTHPLPEEQVTLVFTTLLEGLCLLESLGLHHPNISAKNIFLSTKNEPVLCNPYLFDSFWEELLTVYLNDLNTMNAKLTHNAEKLSENVYDLLIVILCLCTGTPESTYVYDYRQYNKQKITSTLKNINHNEYSQNLIDLLSHLLMQNYDQMPMPIELSNRLGLHTVKSSYYHGIGHKQKQSHGIDHDPSYMKSPQKHGNKGGRRIFDEDHKVERKKPDIPS